MWSNGTKTAAEISGVYKMDLVKICKDTDFSSAIVPEGKILTFTGTDENGIPVTRYKNSSGNFGTVSGGGTGSSGQDSAFTLVRVTDYIGFRPELTAPSQVVVSGMGTVESEYGDSADFSDVNGTYTVTDETKYLSGLKRVYKQEEGSYYLRGYDPDDYEYAEYSAYWCITQNASNSRWEAKAIYEGESIPSGTNTWYSEMLGNVSIPTEVTNTTYPEQPLVLKCQKVNAYDPETRIWDISDSISSFSGYEKTPVPDNVYACTNGRLFGDAIAYINEFPSKAALFAIDASKGVNDIVNGGSPTIFGDGQEVLRDGEFCFDNARALDYAIGASMSALQDFTIEMDYTITSDKTGYCGFFGNKSSWSTMNCHIQWGRTGYRPAMFWNGYFEALSGGDEHPEWVNDGKYHHVAMVKYGRSFMLFSDGIMIATYTGDTPDLNLAIENKLSIGVQHVENAIFPGRMKHFRVIGGAVYKDNFAGNLPSWVGE